MTETKIGNYRWRIVALLFFATTINYLDRQVIGLLKPLLEKEFNWSEIDYSNIVVWFQFAYAFGLLAFGSFVDKVGTKLGYIVSIVIWSLAAIGHAFSRSTAGFAAARAALGLGEAGNFPAAIKTTAEWFPKKERALATGIFNSGTNIGAVVAPACVPWLAIHYGWQEAFIITGAIGFIWLICWWIYYEVPAKQKKLSKAEFDYIHSDNEIEEKSKVPWLKLLTYKQTWAFAVGKFLTDPIWWFYLFWLPSYLSNYKLDLSKLGLPLIIIYTMTTIGSIGGGWLSSRFIKKGWSINKSRKTAMLIFALCVLPVLFVQTINNLYVTVVLISLAAAAHQAWSANIFTTASDMFPKKAVSSVIGIGGMAGAIGGMLFAKIVGYILDHFKALGHITSGYFIVFIICGSAYLIALLIFHLMVPKMEIAKLNE